LDATGSPQVVLAQALSQVRIASVRSSKEIIPLSTRPAAQPALSSRHANVDLVPIRGSHARADSGCGENFMAILYLRTLKHTSKAIIDGSPGEIMVTIQCWQDDSMNLWCLQCFRIGHTSLQGKLSGSNDAGSRQPGESNHQPSGLRSQDMGADEALNLA
jgi:hypothetical protein